LHKLKNKQPLLRGFYTLFIFVFSSGLCAAQPMEEIPVLSANNPVFSEHKEDGSIHGYAVDYTTAILDIAGMKAKFYPLPFARIMKEVETGKLMVATGIGRTAQREDQYFWIAPLTAGVIGLYGKKTINMDELAEQGKTINVSVMRGDYRAQLGSEYKQLVMHEYNNWEQAIGAMLKGRVDAVFLSEFGISIICSNAGLDCSGVARQYTHNIQYTYLAMPKNEKNRAVAFKLAEAAKHFSKSLDYKHMVMRWMPKFKAVSQNVSEVAGVIALGKITESDRKDASLWVITNLEPLFSERDEKGNLSGYAVELVRNILVDAGYQTDILSAPWERILVESAMKPDVLVFSLARTPERENSFHWITPITQNSYSFYALDGLAEGAESIADLPKSTRVAVLENDFRHRAVASEGLVPVTSRSWTLAIENLLNGEADYLFFSDSGVNVFCSRMKIDCSSIKKVFVYKEGTTYLALSKPGTNQELVNKLRRSAQGFKQSSQFNNLVSEWLDMYANKTALPILEENGVLILGKVDAN